MNRRFLSVHAFARGALGALAAVVALELGLRACEGALGVWRRRESDRPRIRSGAYHLYALGESTTAPLVLEDGEDVSWPAQLEGILRREIPGAVVENLAVPGCDAAHQLGRLRAAMAARRPDLIVAMLGVNDWNKAPEPGGLDRLRSVALLRSARAALLRRRDRAAFNSEQMASTRFAREKQRLVESIYAQDRLDRAARIAGSADRAWLDDAHFRFSLLTAIQSRAADACGKDRSPPRACRELELLIWNEARESLRRGDRSRRVFHFALYAAMALQRYDDAADLIKAYGPLGVISIPSAELIHQLAQKRPDLWGRGARASGGSRYASTRRSFLELVGAARASGVPIVFMQYPAVPAEPLRRLLAAGRPETRFSSYPESFRGEWPGRLEPPAALVVSNEFMSGAVKRHGYDALFGDRFGFSFGAHFGHPAELGHRLIAEHLHEELRSAGVLPGGSASAPAP